MIKKKSSYSSRLPLAITLIVAAFLSTFAISTYSNKGDDYWVLANPITPGHLISSSDIQLRSLNLDQSSNLYLNFLQEPTGMIATRKMNTGEIISASDVTTIANAMSTSAVPLSVRSVDMAKGLSVGQGVDLYWVLDSRNNEPVMDPILILGDVTLLSFDDAGNSFGGEVGLTVAIEETQVLRVLSSTTQGRLVVVRSHV